MRPRSSGRSTEARIAEMETMTAPELRQHWLRIFDRSPPRWLSRQLMLHALAYRLQEQAEGGLNRAALKRLRQLVDPNGADVPSLPPSTPRLKPGTRLVREWHGETHQVTVLDDGFDYRDARYRSLSEIARAITGTRWSGPLFFGLGKQAIKSSEAGP